MKIFLEDGDGNRIGELHGSVVPRIGERIKVRDSNKAVSRLVTMVSYVYNSDGLLLECIEVRVAGW